jgi:hypothetical protein
LLADLFFVVVAPVTHFLKLALLTLPTNSCLEHACLSFHTVEVLSKFSRKRLKALLTSWGTNEQSQVKQKLGARYCADVMLGPFAHTLAFFRNWRLSAFSPQNPPKI